MNIYSILLKMITVNATALAKPSPYLACRKTIGAARDVMGVLFAPLFLLGFCLVSLDTHANQPFFFIAKQSNESSLTQQGVTRSVVYLRWDIVEGDLPSDIEKFALYRDGALIGEYPAKQLLSADEVTRLYQSASQARRLVETMSLLKEESVLDPNLVEVDVNDYANAILARIERDEYWAQLASKRDFNIAMARNRGAIDQPGQGIFSFELLAVNAQNQTRRVGLVSVDTRSAQNLLPIPGFTQVNLSQCDIPDIKDHYSVALNWSPAGEQNMADRVANQLFIAGYDLYRSTSNLASSVTQAPVRDLASEAKQLPFDNQGQVLFSDLERVNNTLITVSPDTDMTNPEWLETHDELELAGLAPGDKRAYYIVARDFTGNFGPTSAAIVTIGDLSRPPAPWDIDIYLSEENQRVELSFEKVGADAYLESFGLSKRVCGVSDSGVISFVGRDESCAAQRHKMIQTQVDQYLVYRFDNFAEASRFKDSDGDGLSDGIERPNNLQCTTASQPSGALIESNQQEIQYSDHTRIVLSDETPAQNKGDIYWYRLAAKAPNGRLSFLSEPLRVNFPDRTLPQAPVVTVSYPGDGTEACGCELDYQASTDPWSFTVESGLGNNVTLSCNGNSYALSAKDLANNSSLACNIPNIDNSPIAQDCALGGQAVTNASGFACNVSIPSGTDFCETGNMRINALACESVPAPAGLITDSAIIESTPTNPEHCVSIYQQIAGEVIKVSSNCGEDTSSASYVVEKGEFCGFSVTHDKNNNVSTRAPIECREVVDPNDNTPLLAPRIDLMRLGEDFASLNLALPTQKQSIVEVEVFRKQPSETDKIVRRAGIASSTEPTSTINVELPVLSTATDQWCARARIYGASESVDNAKRSAWSKERCELRASSTLTQPEWLSWPGLKTASKESDLQALSNDAFGVVSTSSPLSRGIHIPLVTVERTCVVQPNSVTLLGEVAQQPVSQGPALVDLICSKQDSLLLSAKYASVLNFIVFRQSRLGGTVTNFKQVSPLINYVHWAAFVDEKNNERFRIRDPYIWSSVVDMANSTELTFNYADRAPLLAGREYRYQFVYFDADHQLASWRQTDWVMFDGAQNAQTAGGQQ